jgi:hypothetical protein
MYNLHSPSPNLYLHAIYPVSLASVVKRKRNNYLLSLIVILQQIFFLYLIGFGDGKEQHNICSQIHLLQQEQLDLQELLHI